MPINGDVSKQAKRWKRGKLLLSFLVIGMSTDAEAVSLPRGREVTGIVHTIDSMAQMVTIVVDSENGEAPLVVKWSRHTIARVHGKPVTFEDLQTGTRVTVRYVRPLFGPPFMKMIRWCETAEFPKNK